MTHFRQDKATQAAAHLLGLRGGHMSHLKLIKLLYFADREALLRWGRPITYDRYVSMDHGPVLSTTLNLINGYLPPEESEYWRQYIGERVEHEVELIGEPPYPTDSLSEAEVQLLGEIFARHGQRGRWELRDLAHELPEWKDPEGSALPIEYDEILQSGGLDAETAARVQEELEARSFAEDLLT